MFESVTYKAWHGACRKVWNQNPGMIIAHKRAHFTGSRNGIAFRFGFEIFRNGLSREFEPEIVDRTRDYARWTGDMFGRNKCGPEYRRACVKGLRALRMQGIRSLP